MADYTEQLSEVLCPLTYLHASNQTANTSSATALVCVANYHRVWFVMDVGVIAAGGAVDARLWQAQDVAGTGLKVITGKIITQLTQAGGDSNSLVCIELQTEELDVDNGFDCVKAIVGVAVNTAFRSAILYGAVPRYAPAPTTNWEERIG